MTKRTLAGHSNVDEDEIEAAYWDMKARQDRTQGDGRVQEERDAFKWAVRTMLDKLYDE